MLKYNVKLDGNKNNSIFILKCIFLKVGRQFRNLLYA